MPAVRLTRMWFAPGGVRYRAGMYDDLPDYLLDHLPSSATVSDGKVMVPADEWKKAQGKRKAVSIEDLSPPDRFVQGGPEKAPDTDPVSQSVPANAEGASPTSPKSSGPETTALPSSTSKAGEVTASGTEAKKDEEVKPTVKK